MKEDISREASVAIVECPCVRSISSHTRVWSFILKRSTPAMVRVADLRNIHSFCTFPFLNQELDSEQEYEVSFFPLARNSRSIT